MFGRRDRAAFAAPYDPNALPGPTASYEVASPVPTRRHPRSRAVASTGARSPPDQRTAPAPASPRASARMASASSGSREAWPCPRVPCLERAARTISTFSCDIAYSASPTASRASVAIPVDAEPDDLAVAERPDHARSASRARSPLARPCRHGAQGQHDDLVAGSRNSSTSTRTSQASRSPRRPCLTADRPLPRCPARAVASDSNSTFVSKLAASSRRGRSASMQRTSSTFSCDIAYSSSPTALRASAWSRYERADESFPSRKTPTAPWGVSTTAPLPRPRPSSRPRD